MAIETPDLTGMSERERRIFAMGAHWAEGTALECVASMLETIPVPRGLSGAEVVRALVAATKQLADMGTCLEFLKRDGAAP